MIITSLYYLLVGLSSILLTYIVGRTIVSIFTEQSNLFFHIFLSLLTGLLFIVIFYAFIQSKGKTIIAFIIPVIGYLVYYYKNLINWPQLNLLQLLKQNLWISCLFIILYVYQSVFFFDYNQGLYKSLYTDPYWYATFCNSQKIWGIENYFTSVNFFFPSSNIGLVPYHYPELWLTAFFSHLFSIGTIQSLYLVVYPILITTFLTGICSIYDLLFTKKAVTVIVSFVLLFSSGLTFRFYNSFSVLQYSNTLADISLLGLFGTKYAFVYPFFLLGFILVYKKEFFIGSLVLSIIPFFSIGFLPAIVGGLLLSIHYYYLGSKTINKKQFLILCAVLFLNIVLILVFYSLHKSTYSNNFAFTYFQKRYLPNGYINYSAIRAFCGNTIYYCLKIVVIFCPALLLFVFLKKLRNTLFFISVSMIGCGIVASSLYLGFTDGNQFANNILICLTLIQIIGLSTLISAYQKNKTIVLRLSIVAYFCCLLSTIYFSIKQKQKGTNWYKEDKLFVQKASKQITEKQTCVLLFLDSLGYTKNDFNSWHVHNDFYLATQYMANDIIFTLGNPELYHKCNKLSAVDSFSYHYLTPLNIWKKTDGNSLENFIIHFKIKYFYFKTGVKIPAFISRNAQIITISPITNSIFIKLKE